MCHLARALIAALILLSATPLCAQQPQAEGRPPSPLSSVAKRVAADPTTYAPGAILYGSMRLDWNSSQPFFQHGFVEDNPRFTVSGRGHDVAISYGAGNRQIMKDALATLPLSVANNVTSRVVEHALAERFPEHRKLVAVLGWIERISFASYQSYVVSANHFRQWQQNRSLASQLGY